jgi:hypothetical protein
MKMRVAKLRGKKPLQRWEVLRWRVDRKKSICADLNEIEADFKREEDGHSWYVIVPDQFDERNFNPGRVSNFS